jgi:hypothetical protein
MAAQAKAHGGFQKLECATAERIFKRAAYDAQKQPFTSRL